VTPERWQQIARVYQSAIEQPPAARGAFLADMCGEDSDLRREVESLLARGDARVLVDQPVDVAAAAVMSGAPGLAPGSFVGPYRVTALIGEGGMGQVIARTTRSCDSAADTDGQEKRCTRSHQSRERSRRFGAVRCCAIRRERLFHPTAAGSPMPRAAMATRFPAARCWCSLFQRQASGM
jgi:hypothetical protein